MENQTEGREFKVRQQQRSPQEIEAWVARFRQSGQTQRGFAAAHGLQAGTLARWLYRRGKKAKAVNGAMVPVKVIDTAGRASWVVVHLPGGVQIEFSGPVEVSVLRELIAAGT
jgi:hypothetical protein